MAKTLGFDKYLLDSAERFREECAKEMAKRMKQQLDSGELYWKDQGDGTKIMCFRKKDHG